MPRSYTDSLLNEYASSNESNSSRHVKILSEAEVVGIKQEETEIPYGRQDGIYSSGPDQGVPPSGGFTGEFLDDIALLRKGLINKDAAKNPYNRTSKEMSKDYIAHHEPRNEMPEGPITIEELESRGVVDREGKTHYSLLANNDASSAPRHRRRAAHKRAPSSSSSTASSISNESGSTLSYVVGKGGTSGSSVSLYEYAVQNHSAPDKAALIRMLPDGTKLKKTETHAGGVNYELRSEKNSFFFSMTDQGITMLSYRNNDLTTRSSSSSTFAI